MAKRSYFDELKELEQTWDMMFHTPPSIPSTLQTDWFKGSAFCIGSGGSVSLAKMWQLTYEHYGFGFAKTITPYEFFHTGSNADTVCLFSASGSNHDILEVFKLALDRNYRIFVVTNTPNSELVRLSKSFPDRSYAVYPNMDTPKDGFLAVNSVVSISSIIYQLKKYFFNEEIDIISPITLAINDHEIDVKQKNFELSVVKTTQIITSEWGIPAGIDLESRFAESGIGNCFLTDPRNFGHGRFLWLAKYPMKSQVVIFSTESSFPFVKRFNRKLPDQVPCLTVNAPLNNILGSIYCNVRSILLFGEFAKRKRIDPGMPTVPQWGRNLHTLYYANNTYQNNNKTKIKATEDYPAFNKSFNAIVLDYDGTMVDTIGRYEPVKKVIIDQMIRLAKDGLFIGIATGRGFSAFNSLKTQLPKYVHESVTIGLYNGTLIYKLSDKFEKPNTVIPIIALIAKLIDGLHNKKIKISVKPTMISIRGGSRKDREHIVNHVLSEIGQYHRFVKYKSSGHSVDIFPHWGTKILVIETVAKSLKSNILCIGDQGQPGGNDEEILNWVPSICVGKNRPSSNLCFWLGKENKSRESAGTLKILKNIMKTDSQFVLDTSPFKV